MDILFFGSTTDSIIVLNKLFSVHYSLLSLRISAVVTQPPRPVGRKQTQTPTPVEIWAKEHNVTVLSFPSDMNTPWQYANPQQVIDTLQAVNTDLIVTASYGQMIPWETIQRARFGGLNVHPSILPRWRGGDPVPWVIMTGDRQIGVTVVGLSKKFDEGLIYAQKKIPVSPTDTSTPLRTKLFEMGADLLTGLLPAYIQGKTMGKQQPKHHNEPYARRLTRDTGFEPWDTIQEACADKTEEALRIERKYRALHPWPGVWTYVRTTKQQTTDNIQQKRLKILKLHLENDTLVIDQVQLEGKNPVSWKQYIKAYHL